MDRAEPITAATSEGSSRGPSIPRLPVEVCGRIIDHVAMGMNLRDYFVEDEPHLAALSSYALVCRDWYYLTWYHLRQRIHLRDREDVLSLSKTLPTKPRLRKVIQHVVISGASPGWRRRRPIRHLGTFVAMLAGKAPMLSRISIEDAQWTIDSVRMEDIHFITTFSSMNTLTLRNVTLSSITQLSRLVSALPRLRELWCSRVNCLREQQLSLASLPLNCANLYALSVSLVSPAVEDLLVCISRASQVRSLHFGVNGELAPPGAASRSQALLVASSTSAERVVLDWDIDRVLFSRWYC
ncbi:uncharacterized protein B0H18DRAFT_603960 [Fomitopsis serialis]|uniref:uncharacterized protein n=1 Tax=Fomitopsis serialis TaxID=139415 RepID=UPI0020078D29|nr:uncharacterized protein B0H18DRAFT_603960 [Neoantrodia serialis]KAH9933874.1 hypothetical protein B0H18DRAFT_603960 [Neoantrodia serialis]